MLGVFVGLVWLGLVRFLVWLGSVWVWLGLVWVGCGCGLGVGWCGVVAGLSLAAML